MTIRISNSSREGLPATNNRHHGERYAKARTVGTGGKQDTIMRQITIFLLLVAALPEILPAGSLFTVVHGDTVQVWDVHTVQNCAAQFIMGGRLSHDTLYVVETDTSSRLATCTCTFDLCDIVAGVPPGSYWAVVYRVIMKKPPYTPETTTFVGSVPFTVSIPSSKLLTHTRFQSACLFENVAIDPPDVPTTFGLKQNYPNPFNPTTTITFSLPYQEHVRLEIFDVLGRKVASLVDESRMGGHYEVQLAGSALPGSGVYFYHIIAGTFSATRAMILLK
jgi:hypothetical protein